MFRYKLRTLLILLAVGPPVMAGLWFGVPQAQVRYRAWQWRAAVQRGEHVARRDGGLIAEDR